MKRITTLILKIIIYLVKNINKNTGMLIDVLENMYALTANMRTKSLKKMIKILIVIVGGKIMEIVVDNKIITMVEIIKIVNNYITLNEVWGIVELWIMWILYIIRINTNIILINVAAIILINKAAVLKAVSRVIGNTISVLGRCLRDTRPYLHTMQNKGVRSCIPFV